MFSAQSFASLNLSGKSVLLTGASGGIGSVIAHLCVARGAFVGLAGMQEEPLQNLSQTCDPEQNSTCILLADLREPGAEHDLLSRFLKHTEGKIHGLVNNAGITRDALALRMPPEDWDSVIDINLTKIFRLTQAALPIMLKQRSGRIINMSSVVGFLGNAGQANYAASKAGLIGLTKTLAREAASRNVLVNAVAPGYIDTPMTAALSDEVRQKAISHVPLQRMGTPEDIAEAVAFLLSDASKYITGETLHVNGGFYMA